VIHTGGTAGVARNYGDGSSTQNWYGNADTFADGAADPFWLTFSAPQVALTPGSYWVVIQSGGTAGVARDFDDGTSTANWYGNADAFSNGAANPFGSGSTGTVNLCVYVTYLH